MSDAQQSLRFTSLVVVVIWLIFSGLLMASPSFTAALLNANYLFSFLSPTGDGVPEQSRIRQDRQGKSPSSRIRWHHCRLLWFSQPDRFYWPNRTTFTALRTLQMRTPLRFRLPLLTLAAVVVTYRTLPPVCGGSQGVQEG